MTWRAASRCQTPATVSCPPSMSPLTRHQAGNQSAAPLHRHQPRSQHRTAGLTFPGPLFTGTSLLRCTERPGFPTPGSFGHLACFANAPVPRSPLCSDAAPRSEHVCRTHPRAASTPACAWRRRLFARLFPAAVAWVLQAQPPVKHRRRARPLPHGHYTVNTSHETTHEHKHRSETMSVMTMMMRRR